MVDNRIEFEFEFKNIGKTTVQGIYVGTILWGKEDAAEQWRPLLRKALEKVKKDQNFYSTHNLVPGDIFKIESKLGHSEMRCGIPIDPEDAGPKDDMHIIGCIIYGATEASEPRHTAFIAALSFEASTPRVCRIWTYGCR
jgi:hypothetical protein